MSSSWSLGSPWFRAIAPLLLLVALVVSAIGVVGMKQHSRGLQMRTQELAAERERLQVEFNQLRLERGAIGAHARIEELAVRQLDMRVPDDYVIVQAPSGH